MKDRELEGKSFSDADVSSVQVWSQLQPPLLVARQDSYPFPM